MSMEFLFRENSLIGWPSSANALRYGLQGYSGFPGPIGERGTHSVNLDHNIGASVIGLLNFCRPSAIVLAVVSSVVDSIYRMAGGAFFHVLKKRHKTFTPLAAYADASSTVVIEAGALGIGATRNHGSPCPPRFGVGLSVSFHQGGCHFRGEASARGSSTTPKVANQYFHVLSAYASAFPFFRGDVGFANPENKKSPEGHSSSILESAPALDRNKWKVYLNRSFIHTRNMLEVSGSRSVTGGSSRLDLATV